MCGLYNHTETSDSPIFPRCFILRLQDLVKQDASIDLSQRPSGTTDLSRLVSRLFPSFPFIDSLEVLTTLSMPKASSDYRAARAVLSAPYPLPVVITRNAPARSPSSPPETPQLPASTLYGAQLYHGFPAYNTRWRELPPAVPPVPYPPSEIPRKRNWTVKLQRQVKATGERSEIELMSGI